MRFGARRFGFPGSLARARAVLRPAFALAVMSQTFDSKSLISAIEVRKKATSKALSRLRSRLTAARRHPSQGGTIHTLRVPLDRRQVQKVWQQCVRKVREKKRPRRQPGREARQLHR